MYYFHLHLIHKLKNINNKWVKPHFAPHIRNGQRKNLNTKKGFMLNLLKHMKEGMKKRVEKGRFLQGENEFKDDRRGRCDKFMAHFDEQVERYGYKCPITHIPFTMNVLNQKFDINNQVKIFSNTICLIPLKNLLEVFLIKSLIYKYQSCFLLSMFLLNSFE